MSSDRAAIAGRTVLVTGATGGIGLETARALAGMGAAVVVGARDAARGQAVVDELNRAGGWAELLGLDMASFSSVRQAVERFAAGHDSLDALVNNAGVVVLARRVTEDGHELTWQTDFLSAYLLTRLLLPVLKRAPAPRVVNVSSDGYRAGRMDWEDLELSRNYRGLRAYVNTKLALVLFTRELAKREPGLAVNAMHPGAVATDIWRAAPAVPRAILQLLLPSSARGVAPVVRLVSAPELTGVTGRYFNRFREEVVAKMARSDADALRLWEVAEEATGLSPRR